ncbi:MAG: hypothetical protein M5U07_10450 [Xanthobacteraceae bacterium]|nr:hypothetical protein [Xanthobacteraceae bacterium]
MKKTLIALSAAAALGAGTMTVPTSANAYPAWVIPAIIAAGVGGVVVGGAVINQQAYAASPYYAPRGTVYVQPTAPAASCYVARERTARGWRRVRVCP